VTILVEPCLLAQIPREYLESGHGCRYKPSYAVLLRDWALPPRMYYLVSIATGHSRLTSCGYWVSASESDSIVVPLVGSITGYHRCRGDHYASEDVGWVE
jgi:hypothetical protein